MNIYKFFIPALAYLFFSCTNSVMKKDALIHFENDDYNFSTLSYKKEAEHNFQFTNPGKTPLVIFEVKTSCGCTVPDWPKKPIKSGRKGEIKIKYDAASPGVFHKTITVYFNGEESPQILTIKGVVEYPKKLEATKK